MRVRWMGSAPLMTKSAQMGVYSPVMGLTHPATRGVGSALAVCAKRARRRNRIDWMLDVFITEKNTALRGILQMKKDRLKG